MKQLGPDVKRNISNPFLTKNLKDVNTKNSLRTPDINKIDNTINTFINEYNKKYDYYHVHFDFKLVFENPE